MNKPVIFYHLWTVGEWIRINKNIFSRISESGLSDAMEKMFICVNTDIDFNEIDTFEIDRSKVEFIRVVNNQSEWPTLETLYNKYVTSVDTPILYLHCKGARFQEGHQFYESVDSWTSGMAYFTVNKWKKCVSLLSQGKLTVGIKNERLPVPHYSGNFWWVNSSALRRLPHPRSQEQSFRNRHGAEFWIGILGYDNLFNLDIRKTAFNYVNIFRPEQYEEADLSKKHICMFDNGGNVDWVNYQDMDYTIYKKGNNINNLSVLEAYFTYILTNYDNLPEYIYFLKSTAIKDIPNLPILLKNNYSIFTYFGAFKTTDENDGHPNHPGLPLKEFWNCYFEDACPDRFTFIAGSNFGVSKKEILRHTKETYSLVLRSITNKDNPDEDYCMERMWKDFFTGSLKGKALLKDSSLSYVIERPRITAPTLLIIWPESYKMFSENFYQYLINAISETNRYVVILSGNIDESELTRYLIQFDDTQDFEYKDISFSGWKMMLISTRYIISNKNKKKTIVKNTEEHIRDFML